MKYWNSRSDNDDYIHGVDTFDMFLKVNTNYISYTVIRYKLIANMKVKEVIETRCFLV